MEVKPRSSLPSPPPLLPSGRWLKFEGGGGGGILSLMLGLFPGRLDGKGGGAGVDNEDEDDEDEDEDPKDDFGGRGGGGGGSAETSGAVNIIVRIVIVAVAIAYNKLIVFTVDILAYAMNSEGRFRLIERCGVVWCGV